MRFGKSVFVFALSTAVTACVTLDLGDIKDGILNGRVLVQWIKEDGFIYRKTNDPLSFQPSFMSSAIIPEDMYTDGGSVPRVFWSIPGLSPWGLGPAYIVHDWIFEVHRCGDRGTPEERAITFEQSAQILAEVGKSLIDAGLIAHDKLGAIVWAVQTHYARDLWDRPGNAQDCRRPPSMFVARSRNAQTVVDFEIPSPRRR
jgi:hypothetical protein